MIDPLIQSNIIDFPAVAPQGKSNEWYTPSRYIEAAREVMGGIDLDPASCEMANKTVKAARYYTKEENGLMQPWHGRVWLNPPYARDTRLSNEKRSGVARWAAKLLCEYQSDAIAQSIALLPAQVNASWFYPFWQYPVCFTNHVVRFFLPFGSTNKGRKGRMTDSHIFGTVFVYLGPNEARFIDIFSQFGRIARAIDTPRSALSMPSLWEDTP